MILGDLWVADGNIWYSERIVKEIIDLCKNTDKDSSLADDILNLLDYKGSKGDK